MEQDSTPTMGRIGVEAALEAPEEATGHPALEKQIRTLQAKVDTKAEEIRSNEDLDTSEKRRQIQSLWSDALEAKQIIEGRYERALEEEAEGALRKLFYTGTNRDAVRAAYDDVFDRTELAWTSGEGDGIQYAREEMARLMERAERTGDKALLTAIGHLAAERGIHALRDMWLATSAEKQDAWELYNAAGKQLRDFRNPAERAWQNISGPLSLRRPPEAAS